MTSCSWRTFLTQCARCHWTSAHSVGETCAQPGSRVQSGSTSSRCRYAYGCSGSVIAAVMMEGYGRTSA